MATTVGFVSEKGGVGKTTACYHLAVALSQFEGKKVIVVDTDYQRGGLTCRMFPSKIEAFRSGKVTDVTLFDRFEQLYGGGIGQPKSVDVLPAVEEIPITVRMRIGGKTGKTETQVLKLHPRTDAPPAPPAESTTR